MHIEFLLEEPSAEALRQGVVGKLLPAGTTWNFIVFQGKHNLLAHLGTRLKAYFGAPIALCTAYPGVPSSIALKAPFRYPEAIAGGTWEALERVLQRAGYFKGGLPKIQVARKMAKHLDPGRNQSPSFRQFAQGLAAR